MEINFDKPIAIREDVVSLEHYYTEGPVADGHGGIFFTTLTGGEICHWQEGRGIIRRRFDGWPNGQAWTHKGLLVCDSKNSRLVQLDRQGDFLAEVVSGQCAGKPVRVPNDVIAAPDGGFYFTDSTRHEGRVFYVSPKGGTAVMADKLDYPNGLALEAGGKALIVAESYANRLVRIRLDAPGIPGKQEIWCALPGHPSGAPTGNLPDGIALDAAGRVWVAHYGMGVLQVVDRGGRLLKSVPTGMPLTSNVCFGRDGAVFATGGSAEPGPGKVVKLTLTNK